MIRRLSVLLVSALTVAVVQASPAAAGTTGNVVFHCEIDLPAWPDVAGSGGCEGTALVSVSGVSTGGSLYTLAGPGAFHWYFDYAAACIAGAPPVLWNAAGRIAVGPVLAVKGGAVMQGILSADITVTGTPASFTFTSSNHFIAFADGDTAGGSTGFGEASMALVPGPSNVCPVGGPISGYVDGWWHLAI